MKATAVMKTARVSPQKARLVADQIRNVSIEAALDTLTYSPRKASGIIKKVLESAIANAENNEGADIDELFVSRIMVDEGPRLKRFRARAKGRGTRIIKRTCHITVDVAERA